MTIMLNIQHITFSADKIQSFSEKWKDLVLFVLLDTITGYNRLNQKHYSR